VTNENGLYVTLRFYGRFLYLVPTKPGPIKVWAPNFDHVRFGPHRTQMSIRRDQIVWMASGKQMTNFQPTGKSLSDRADVGTAEILDWDLSGLTVTYQGVAPTVPTLTVTEAGAEILDLRELEKLAGNPEPQLDPSAGTPDPRGKTNTVFEISSGEGTAMRVDERAGPYTFVVEADAEDGTADFERREGEGKKIEKRAVDVVEFRILLEPSRPALTLTFTSTSGRKEIVTVSDGTMVNFTNLCMRFTPPVRPDLEFSQYYSLFLPNGSRDVRIGLIPVEPPPAQGGLLGEGEDCEMCAVFVVPE